MIRVGFGYDIHRLAPGRELWLGCLLVPHDRGLLGHSDGDVVAHALCDAAFGAAGLGDLGTHFPPGDPVSDAPGRRLIEVARQRLDSAGGSARASRPDDPGRVTAPGSASHTTASPVEAWGVLGDVASRKRVPTKVSGRSAGAK
ncbi:MAG: 2-C-methyl-D-erythritol 2,4-cyclodiphosphate synthase [Candidatus Eisenbacteria bacterium]